MANNVVLPIIFEPDTSKITGALDQLQKSGSVDTGAAAAYQAGNTELKKRNDLLAQEKKLVVDVTGSLKTEAVSLAQVQKGTAAASDALIKQTAATGTNQKATESLRAEKRRLQMAIAELLVNGQKESAQYEELVTRAGLLDDAMKDASATIARTGSDTRGLDNTLQIATGVTSAFSGAQGAVALFGEENEDAQKALLKVNAAMAILTSLQQLQAISRDESIKSLVMETRTRLINTATMAVENGLNSTSVVVRGAATVAQYALNAAMAANPIGLLVVAFAAVITAVVAYTNHSTKARTAQLALNGAIDSATAGLEAEYQAYDRVSKKQAAVDAAENARQSTILTNELVVDRIKAQGTAREIENLKKVLATYKKNTEENIAATKKLHDLEQQLNDQNAEGRAKTTALAKALLTEQQNDLQAAADAAVKIARNGSFQELNAKKAAASEARDIALDNLNRQESDQITKNKEKAVIEADYQDSIEALNIEAADKNKALLLRRLNDEKAALDNLLIAVRAGSEAQLKVQLDQLDKQAQIDKAAIDRRNVSAALVAKEEQNIIIRTEVEKRNLRMQFADKQIADASFIEMTAAQTRVAAFQEGTNQYFAAQRVALAKTADNEALAIQQSEDQQDVKASKIKLIYMTLNKDLDALSQQATQKEYDRQKGVIDALNDLAVTKLNVRANDPLITEAARFQASQDARTKQLQKIENDRAAIHQHALADQAYAESQYQADLIANEAATAAKRGEIDNAYAERKKATLLALRDAAIAIEQEASDTIFAIGSARRQQELDNALNDLSTERDTAISNKNLTENQKASIQKRFDNEARRLKLEAARKERKAAIDQAIVNGALGVTNAFATAPTIIAGAILAAVVAATTIAQIAKINNTPLPAYAKGTKKAAPGWKWVGEEGPELIHSKGGETVLTATQSMQVQKNWESMPSDHSDVIAAFSPDNGGMIDYDKLGQAVAKYMPKQPNVSMSADNEGFSMYVETQNRRTKILNKRYSTK